MNDILDTGLLSNENGASARSDTSGATAGRSRPVVALVATVVVYTLAVFVIPDLSPLRALTRALPWLTGGIITQTVLLLSALLLMRLLGRRPWHMYGFRSVRPGLLLAPLAGAVGVALAGLVVAAILTRFLPGPGPGTGQEGGLHPAARQGMVHIVLAVWLYASLCEEVLYRGWLQSELDVWKRGERHPAFSIPVLVPALLFSLGHLCLISSFGPGMLLTVLLTTFGIGWLAGYHRQKTQSLLPAYLVHLTANVVGSGLPLLMGRLMGGGPGSP